MSHIQKHIDELGIANPDEKKAYQYYNSGGSFDLNYQMRAREIDSIDEIIMTQLNQLIAKMSPLEKDMVVWRGFSKISKDEFLRSLLIPTDGFTSFSRSSEVAITYAGNTCCLMKVNIPKGNRLLFLEADQPEKEEIVLPPGYVFRLDVEMPRVISPYMDLSKLYTIEVTAVPYDASMIDWYCYTRLTSFLDLLSPTARKICELEALVPAPLKVSPLKEIVVDKVIYTPLTFKDIPVTTLTAGKSVYLGHDKPDTPIQVWLAQKPLPDCTEELLAKAVDTNDTPTVQRCLKKGINVYLKDKNGITLLMKAVANKYKKIVRLLLDAGGTKLLEARDIKGRTALTYISNATSPNVTELLMEHKVDMETVDKDKKTALMIGTYYNSELLVSFLLENKVDANKQDKYGKTALIYASDNARLEIAKKLVGYGADVNIKDRTGSSALDYATKRGSIEIIEVLKKAGAK